MDQILLSGRETLEDDESPADQTKSGPHSLFSSIAKASSTSGQRVTDEMSVSDVGGTENPALNNSDLDTNQVNTPTKIYDENDSAHHSYCIPDGIFSPDSEYDETLAFPDSITILSMGDDNPVLVQRKHGNNDDDDCEIDSIVPDTDIPFSTIYHSPIKFSSFQRKVFIPGVEVHVQITDNERSITTHLLNPNLYTIQLTHGPFTWTIKKRYKHFNVLHQQLRVFRASLNFPFPTRSHKERRASFRNAQQEKSQDIATTNDGTNSNGNVKKKPKSALPRFPNRPESLVTVEMIPTRIQQLEEYLYNLLNISLYRNHHETVNFLEVSQLSFIGALGEKGKEGPVMKRTGSTRPGQAGCNCFGCLQNNCCIRCNYFCSDVICGAWRNRFFFIKETSFGYIRPDDGEIRSVILFDQGFDISTGMYSTGMRNGLQILTNNRQVVIKCWTRRRAKEWMNFFKTVANVQARDFTSPNPHMSFAPVRSSVQAGWFVDGSSYMNSVADALEGASEEIYIADWWLSPEIYLKRPAISGDYWRLDKILQRKAMQGVKVFILLYKEVEMALGINSYYSKQKLVESHENIKVIRHPDHARVGVFFWAHHEKIVCVDQTYAFLGGIDLCYGRWDDFRHRLTDLGSISNATATSSTQRQKNAFFTDSDSALGGSQKSSRSVSVRLQDHDRKPLPTLEPGDRLLMPPSSSFGGNQMPENIKQNTPEMERRKMMDKFKDNVRKGKGFVQRLASIDGSLDTPDSKKTNKDKNLFFSEVELEEGRKGGYEDPEPYQTHILTTLDGEAKYWFGKDYTNFIMKDFANLDAPYVDLVDRATTQRMPWHDIGAVVLGSSARDVARHFIQRWNAVKLEKVRDNQSFPYLMPKSYNEIRVFDKLLKVPLHRVTCQVLRSVSSWSCGFIEQDLVEQSIHDAYIQTITKAQHYIYIENQFFITLQMGNGTVRNQIGETLFKRIIRAYKENKTFRVYVVMPLLPGFEGDVGGTSGNSLRAITHWNYASISRGKHSILVRLKEAGIEDPSEYISFHSLRTHAVLNNVPVTELIYVHSKLLIADDRVMICGSANINDRSLIGKRDSEVAVIITDEEFEDGRMNGETYPCGIFAGRLRKYLFREHLGLLEPNSERIPIDVTDPVLDMFWRGVWKRTSHRNTEIYDEVFKCIPSDNVTSFLTLKKYQEDPPICKSDPETAMRRISQIQGHLVHLPLLFLNSETLTPPNTSKEGLIPTSVWT